MSCVCTRRRPATVAGQTNERNSVAKKPTKGIEGVSCKEKDELVLVFKVLLQVLHQSKKEHGALLLLRAKIPRTDHPMVTNIR